MADGTTKPVIFISYSHKDEPDRPGPDEVAWLSFVQSYLAPAVKSGIFELWVDEHVPGGGDWEADIKRKLAICDIFILLVSNNSLSSEYIVKTEFKIVEERKATEVVHIFPIVLTPFSKKSVPWLMKFNLRPPNGEPLFDLSAKDRAKKMVEIADEVAELAAKIAEKKEAAKVTGELIHVPPATIRISVLPPAIEASGEASQELAIALDISHLPETAYERLVGRDGELKRLDDAWTDPKINIISLIAEGGAGKSALVNEWLKRLQADKYRGAEEVLGWSFYSQGSKERATAADEFLNWALDKLGIKLETTSATAKGDAIAEALMRRRVLLVLDGVEPLQHGLNRQQGELKDTGLRALLRRFASEPPVAVHGLIVLTSRLPVKDIARWQAGSAAVEPVDKLSDEAGAALLRDNGVWGTDKELRAAAHDFGGHPLALGLLASFLKETQTGDVRRRDHIRRLLADTDNPGHDHARRVMESMDRDWLVGQPVLLAIMHIVGLFDRPASGDCFEALRANPAISGLTDQIVKLEDGEWQRAVTRLREVRLLAPLDPAAPDAYDAHPLVREWFGEQLRRTNKEAWKSAHARLYEHLSDTTNDWQPATLEGLAPLYQAIAHGCQAQLYQQAFDHVLLARIWRRNMYTIQQLGSVASDLAALSWFFDRPYDLITSKLKKEIRPFLLLEVGICLGAQARFVDAMSALHRAIALYKKARSWRHPPHSSFWVSAVEACIAVKVVELLLGNTTRQAVDLGLAFARRSKRAHLDVYCRAILATTLQVSGKSSKADKLFIQIGKFVSSKGWAELIGFSQIARRYCRYLLDQGKWQESARWARMFISFENQTLVDRGTARLAVAQAYLTRDLSRIGRRGSPLRASSIARLFEKAVDILVASANIDELPVALLARGMCRRCFGEWSRAARDLDEVEEIAELGPMRLYLCDMALARARLAFAKTEAFAPLNPMPKPVVPSTEEIAKLKAEAEKQLKIAADYIETCGYHRRDEELAELQAVLRGERKFADLPPRV